MVEGGECFLLSHSKRVRKHYMRSPNIWSNQRAGGSAGHLQELLITRIPSQACADVRVGCCCFCFDSSPVLGQSPSVTHTYWLLADFGHFSSEMFFFFFLQRISSCFFQIQYVDEITVLLSQSFLDLFKVKSQLSKQGDFIES